jgi:hypothetical protein
VIGEIDIARVVHAMLVAPDDVAEHLGFVAFAPAAAVVPRMHGLDLEPVDVELIARGCSPSARRGAYRDRLP